MIKCIDYISFSYINDKCRTDEKYATMIDFADANFKFHFSFSLIYQCEGEEISKLTEIKHTGNSIQSDGTKNPITRHEIPWKLHRLLYSKVWKETCTWIFSKRFSRFLTFIRKAAIGDQWQIWNSNLWLKWAILKVSSE